MAIIHLNKMLTHEAKMALFKDNKERRVALSFLGSQGTILTTEIPQNFSGEEAKHNGPGAQPKWHKTKAKQALRGVKQALRGVKQPQSLKHP